MYSFQALWAVNQPERLARDLFGLAGSVREDRRGLLNQAIDRVMLPSIVENFVVDGRPDPWEPLANSTVARRGGTDDPLTDTGKGERAATAKARWRITRERAEYRGDSFPSST